MIYSFAEDAVIRGSAVHDRACAIYRASAARVLGYTGWTVEPVFMSAENREGPGTARRRLWTYDDDGAGVLCDAVFQTRHGRPMGENDVLAVLPEAMCELLGRSGPEIRFARCVAYDIGAVTSRWTGVSGDYPENSLLSRLACTGIALGAFYSDETMARAEILEVGAWCAERMRLMFGYNGLEELACRSPQNVVLMDIIARTSYAHGMNEHLCMDGIPENAEKIVDVCRRAIRVAG